MFRLSPFFPNDCLGRRVSRFLPSAILSKWEWNQSQRQLFWSHCNVARDTVTSNNLILNILNCTIVCSCKRLKWREGALMNDWSARPATLISKLWLCLSAVFSGESYWSVPSQLLFLERDVEQETIFPSQLSGTCLAFSSHESKFRFRMFKNCFFFIPKEALNAFSSWLCCIVGNRMQS